MNYHGNLKFAKIVNTLQPYVTLGDILFLNPYL